MSAPGDFDLALQEAMRLDRARTLRMLALSGLVLLLAAGAGVALVRAEALGLLALVLLAAGVAVVFLLRNLGGGSLAWLKGSHPEDWLASPSHGLVVLEKDAVLIGRVGRLVLDAGALNRCGGAGYDDDRHVLVVHEVSTHADPLGPQDRPTQPARVERDVRHQVKLDARTTPQAAVDFAMRIERRAAR